MGQDRTSERSFNFELAEEQRKSLSLSTVDLMLAAAPSNYRSLALSKFDEGRKAAEREDWAGASRAFASAGHLDPSPAASFNEALAELRQGHRYSAFELLSKIPEANVDRSLLDRIRECRTAIRQELSDVTVRIGQDKIHLVAEHGDSSTHLAGAHLEELRLPADPPEYIVASGAGSSPARPWERDTRLKIVFDPAKSYRIVAQKGGSRGLSWQYSPGKPWSREFNVVLDVLPTPPLPKNPWRVPMIVTTAVGAATAVGAGVVAIYGAATINSIRNDPDQCPQGIKCNNDRRINEELIPMTETGLWVAGGGAVVAGTSLLILKWTSPEVKPKDPPARSWSPRVVRPVVRVGLRGVMLEGAFF
ncbi:hypothetical protein BE21_52745 [Sorangium cellulosum]|uniref:Uncharacterized protein n=1 Tax=Sorangium cellulosum TaxID=56 RepID=A0A150TF33_SORCE|nr:hypothetical protein BE21_52745 [Sorangium cellulosum]